MTTEYNNLLENLNTALVPDNIPTVFNLSTL